ncbi:MAG: hypothetical protein R3A51_15570 [Nannocystaceae bacterium]|nr:hypothetical protein [Myxococcales bacterium]
MSIVLWIIAIALPVLLGIAWSRRKAGTGLAGAMAEVGAMLNPAQPDAALLASLRAGDVDEDADDEGETGATTRRRPGTHPPWR